MSPLWRDEVGIFVGPGGAALTRMGRGLRPEAVAEKAITVPRSNLNDWAPTLAALADELADPQWRDANARVVVGDHWVRYAIAPWSDALTDDGERLAHGRLILQQTYGDGMAGWTVALAETLSRRSQLVCAIPTQLEADLRGVAGAAGLRLVSLQPHLAVAFNRWRAHIPDAGGWFVTIDEGALAAVRLERDNWEEVHCVRIGSDWSAELRRLRTFGRLASGRSEGCRVLVDAPDWLRRIGAAGGDGLEWLEPAGEAAGTLEKLARVKEAHQ